tara:strand:+ start:7689 stop:8540 length:852 start_codon:yes stop_codon:yes gene_type:complete
MKHNKYKNVGVIFESMIHHTLQLISEGNTEKAGVLMGLVRKNFISNTALAESYNVFSQLLYTEAINYYHASKFYGRILKEYNSVNEGKVNAELSRLFEDIKKDFVLKEVVDTRIPNYKLFSSFRISSDQEPQHITAKDRMNIEKEILEHLINNKELKKLSENHIQSGLNSKEELETSQLAMALAFRNFEKEYRGRLGEDQKDCLIKYFSSTSKEFNGWATSKINIMLDEIADKQLTVDNGSVKEKLGLVFERLEKISKDNKITSDSITEMMMGFELCKQLKYI